MSDVQCGTCTGLGETVAASRHLGGGAINDDWDTCPTCMGAGTVTPSVKAATQSRRETINTFIAQAYYTALHKYLESPTVTRRDALRDARAAMIATGHTESNLRQQEAHAAREHATKHELEAAS